MWLDFFWHAFSVTSLCNDESCFGNGICEGGTTEAIRVNPCRGLLVPKDRVLTVKYRGRLSDCRAPLAIAHLRNPDRVRNPVRVY